MFCGSFLWIIFPVIFFGMMILGIIFSGRRGRWFCCFPPDNRYDYRDRISKLEDEIERLKGK
ncbi:MAG: hypothetical protein JSW64_08280 [Candidatus Zixiibacteriota bacterium]|nr:MAG: hypothetical protein JSW64_08280 [candidate division Zixibacteria bacterium]